MTRIQGKVNLQNRLKVFLVLTAVAFFAIIFIYRITIGRARNTYEAIDLSNQVIQRAAPILASVLKVESMSRGFALTGSREYIDNYENEVVNLISRVKSLDELTYKHFRQRHFESLNKVIESRISFANNLIQLRATRGLNAAMDFASTGTGQLLTQAISNQLHKLTSHEEQKLSQKKIEFHENSRNSQMLFIGLTVFIVVILSIAAHLILKNYKLRDENEKLLNQSHEELLALNKELEAFTYSVSHDLRAPLRAINGYAKIIHEDHAAALDSEGREVLGVIMSNSKKMGELIDGLLDFAKLGRKDISLANVNMNETVRSVIEDAKFGLGREILFKVGDLPQVHADKLLIKQVWVNLISNAIKYSREKSGPEIEIGSYNDHHDAVFYVKDNGSGFDMSYYDKLFGVFQRLHSQEEFEGTGIGLAMVHKIIRRHGGSVWAESMVGEGATFYFKLPNTKS
jgi:signal transduction histidine kinase